MIRKLKTLGLALVAVFVMSAVATSTASAQLTGKLTSAFGEDVTLTGEETGVAQNRFTVGTDFAECAGSTYTGHAVLTPQQTSEGKKHKFLANGSTEITMTPITSRQTALQPTVTPAAASQ